MEIETREENCSEIRLSSCSGYSKLICRKKEVQLESVGVFRLPPEAL